MSDIIKRPLQNVSISLVLLEEAICIYLIICFLYILSLTVKNGNIIRADFIEDTIKNDETDVDSALFRQYGSCFWAFQHCMINTIYIHYRKI